MTPLVPAVCGALVVAGLIGMVYALRPAPPKSPRPAHTVTPFGRLGSRINQLSPRTRKLIVAGAVTGLLYRRPVFAPALFSPTRAYSLTRPRRSG
ncbi:MAG: hypothetical protein CMJ44_03760 [Pimelobacter sp.]|nr:hypothetical protein [Pimelobacter sp.]